MSKVLVIKNDMKSAMKDKDKEKLTALRMLISSLEKEKVKQKLNIVEDLNEDSVVAVIQKEVKMLDQERESLVNANRNTELVDAQKEAIKVYLPEQLSESDLEVIIKNKMTELSIESAKQQGQLMGVLSKELKGKADMGQVSKIVRNLLN